MNQRKKMLAIACILIVAGTGIISASLFNYYAEQEVTATVSGSVLIDGEYYEDYSFDSVELNETVTYSDTSHTIEYIGTAPMKNVSFYWIGLEEGITVETYYDGNLIGNDGFLEMTADGQHTIRTNVSMAHNISAGIYSFTWYIQPTG